MTDDLISRAAAVQRIANVSPVMQPADTQASLNYHLGYTDGRKAAEWAVRNIPAAQVQAEPVAIDCDLGMACHFPRTEVYYSEAERNRAQATPLAPVDLDALVQRLRTITSSGCNPYSACHEAADAITALRASAGKGEVTR